MLSNERLLVAVLPLAAAALARQAEVDDETSWFDRLPLSVRDYLVYYATTLGKPGERPSRSMHLSVMLGQACRALELGNDPHAAVCGWVLRDAWSRLGGWWALELRPQRGMTCTDHITAEYSSQELFHVDRDTLHRLWTEDTAGTEWLHLWHAQASRDPRVLERAGLGEHELTLLSR